MTLTITRRRRAGALVATGALAASALLFAPAAQAADALADVRESQIAPTETAATYAGWHQGAENPAGSGVWGKYKVTTAGLELEGRSQVINGYANNKVADLGNGNPNVALSVLSAARFTKVSGDVTFQVPIYSDAITTTEKFATLRSVDPATDVWQSSRAIGSGSNALAANTNFSIAQLTAAIGTSAYKVIAFGVYNDSGTGIVKDLTFNSTKYTFANNAPTTPTSQTVTTKLNTASVLPLPTTDIDGNALTYTATAVVGGTVSGPGASLTFTPAANFRGTAVVNYTVTDGRGGSTNGSISIKVEKLKTNVDIYRVKPVSGKISVRNTVSFYAAVTIDGQKAPKGTTIQGYAKSKLVVTGKVNSSGKVKLTLPGKLPYGTSTLKAVKVGSSTLDRSEDSVKVRVTKK